MNGRYAAALLALASAAASPASGQVAAAPPAVSGDVNANVTSFVRDPVQGLIYSNPVALTYHSNALGDDLPAVSYDVLSNSGSTADFKNFAFIFASTNLAGAIFNASYVHTNPIPTAAGDTYAQTLFNVSLPCARSTPYTGTPDSTSSVNPTRTSVNFAPAVDGTAYGVGFVEATPQAAYQDYVAYVRGAGSAQLYDGNSHPTGSQFRNDISSCSAQTSGNPLVGNPQSLQFSLIDQALDLATFGDALPGGGGEGGGGGDQPANLVGVQYGRTALAGQDGNRVDAGYQRAFRIVPGSRALLIVSLPFTFYDTRGGQQFRGVGAVGLLYPVTPNWTVEPKLAYSGVSADKQGISGQAASASITSQYALYNRWLGRGRLTLGNMVGYTQVTDVTLAGASVSRHPGNFVTRDGLAYEYPLKTQFDGRVASLRASYTYTYVDGDKLFLNQTHDLVLSVGVRTRETALKNSYELLRIGLRGELGDKYDAVYVFGGYRF